MLLTQCMFLIFGYVILADKLLGAYYPGSVLKNLAWFATPMLLEEGLSIICLLLTILDVL
jgi:hypothetical protein